MLVSTIVQTAILLSFVCAVGGLATGLLLKREEVDFDTRVVLALGGNVIGVICALIASLNPALLPIAYEVCGLIMSLGFLVGFLGIGLLIGPSSGR